MKYSDNYSITYENRADRGKEDDFFVHRWSPRSYRQETLSEDLQEILFGAARWTQSCFNEQPWLFITESGPEDREVFHSLLLPGNKKWAAQASLTGFVFAKKTFDRNGKANRFAAFDTGAAWMALTMQARLLGLYTHGMAGIKKSEVYEVLNVSPEDYDILCGFVIGVIDKPEKLEENLQERETPSSRKPLMEIWRKGLKQNID